MTSRAPRPGARVSSDPLTHPTPTTTPKVPLAAIASTVAGAEILGAGGVLVAGAVADSRDVTAGALFFCVPGASVDGHAFARAATEAGAAALVVERWLDLDTPQVRVRSVREAMGPMSAEVFGHPADSLTTVGITGTNGKTTVTYLMESVLAVAGRVPGVIGTTGARIAGEPAPLARTTPEAPDLHRLLALMRRRGVVAVAMEVSSHAMSQRRVDGVRFDVAAFTNLSRDHLDFHGSMEDYFGAKAELFTPARADHAVLNLDDERGRELAERGAIPATTYGFGDGADVRATDVEADTAGVAFRIGRVRVRSSLRGAFNVPNCMCAFALARVLGIDDEMAAAGIAALPGVPGRMEPIEGGQEFLVVVDYAHTPDSIDNVLRAARPLASGRLIVVFGCGGDRDRDKRPLMGRAATALADLAVLTSDNPRSEDPIAILADIESGAKEGGGSFVVEPDRRDAIGLALREARAGDVVVIAGKGHESTQELASGAVTFDDRVVTAEELRAVREER
jgi:UDP-N-acetylmuramoyl-L-alanyl-D-glutamate--2,6-diaminopimelate ligase